MAILTFPGVVPSSAEWKLVSNTKTFRSPLDGSVQTSESPGARWQVSMSFTNQSYVQARAMAAFLVSLRGETGRFYLHDHSHPIPYGVATGTPVVSGAAQTGGSINTSGWTPSTTGILLAGDYIGFGSAGLEELHMVVADVNSDAGGLATIPIEAPIRVSPANGASIVTNQPPAIFKLTTDNMAGWRIRPQLCTFQITCEEAFA